MAPDHIKRRLHTRPAALAVYQHLKSAPDISSIGIAIYGEQMTWNSAFPKYDSVTNMLELYDAPGNNKALCMPLSLVPETTGEQRVCLANELITMALRDVRDEDMRTAAGFAFNRYADAQPPIKTYYMNILRSKLLYVGNIHATMATLYSTGSP